MTDALIEKVARAICLNRAAPACKCKDDGVCKAPAENLLTESNERLSQARAAVLAVLDHFSKPSNITAFRKGQHEIVASVMRAARDEVSRG